MSPNDFDRFVAANGNALLRTAYLMVGDLHESEDIVQETLFKVASRWPRVSRMDNPAAYTDGSSSITCCTGVRSGHATERS